MRATTDWEQIQDTLCTLNYRWNRNALALWQGKPVPIEPYQLYAYYETFLSPDTLASIDSIEIDRVRHRLKFAFIDHVLQQKLLPHETEMRSWAKGATAHVQDEKISFREIIPWCQKSSTYHKRQLLQKETGPLCKFLAPFARNYWNVLLDVLQVDFGFDNYLSYCAHKKQLAYDEFKPLIEATLRETDELYFKAMGQWCQTRFKRTLGELTRFDAINLLGLGEFDAAYPSQSITQTLNFFGHWGIDVSALPGLVLELDNDREKSAQAICIALRIPQEVYVLMKPEGGWIDIETLWHELGHGLAATFTAASIPIVDRELATSFALSEAYAFMLQDIAMSRPFLERWLRLPGDLVETLQYYKTLRDLAAFRRYGAKFLIEFEMFSTNDMTNAEGYAASMERYTGFYHQPESQLFDLVPELYSFDYLLGWMGAALLREDMERRFGLDWMFQEKAGQVLRQWWYNGNRDDIFAFTRQNNLGEVSPGVLLRKWVAAL